MEAFPVSYAQELLYMLDRAAPGLTAYNVSRVRRVRGVLDLDALQRALDTIVSRHEILRTTYTTHQDHAVQVIGAPRAVPIRVVDLRSKDHGVAANEAMTLVRESARVPFDLATDLLLRALLVRVADDDAFLLLETHHIASDGWSRDIMFRELATLYEAYKRGVEAELPTLPIQYADFAIWQREQLAGARLQSLLEYWRGALGTASMELALPTDFPRPAHASFEGGQRTLALSAELSASLRALAQAHQASLYMVVLAAYHTVLHRWTGQDDILSGSPIAGRALSETQGLIGYFANTLVLRSQFGDDPTFGVLLDRVRETALGAYEHQDIPLEKLVLELREGNDRLNPAPLFQVVLTQLDTAVAPLELSGLTMESAGFETGATKFDYTLFMADRPEGLRFTLSYRTDLFRGETAERFLGHLQQVLGSATNNKDVRVSHIPLASPAERAQLAAWNESTVDEGAPATVDHLFEQQAARVGSRAAIVAPRPGVSAQSSVAGALVLSYAELNGRANQLASHLRTLGVGRNVVVGLLLDRSADAFVALLGILKAGGAYMPLSVDAPAARIAQQVNESGARVVITNVAALDRVPSTVQAIALDRAADGALLGTLSQENSAGTSQPGDAAYVLYTSGSTGTPKGVAVTHANAVHYARAISRVLADLPTTQVGDGFAALDGWQFGMVSTLAADLGNTSLLPALLAGGTLHVLGKDVTTEPSRYAQYVAAHQLDVLKITPNHLNALVTGKTGEELASLLPRKWLVFGGEALRPDVARTMLGARKCRVLNHYGPTETTVGVLTNEVTGMALDASSSLGAQTVPLGRPLANTHAYVVSAQGEEQPVGIPGELWLGGAGVAAGYWKRADLTAERFVLFRGERVYRTGDRVRRLADGTLEFLGRTDDQVKVRGFRVELGEVEQVLRAHPGVAQGVVVLRTDTGDAQLVAYAVAKQAGYAVSHSDRPTPEKLTEWLAAQLPEYMVPGAVVLLEALPLTANGKVDKRALPAPDAPEGEAASGYVAPRTETETKLATIWAEVLKKPQVGVTDNFLALGGHSLLAIRVLGRISKTFGVRLALRTLFETPTIEQLGELLDIELQLAALESMSEEDATKLLATEGATQVKTE